MSYGRSKTGNQYADCVFNIDATKTVWMAIAFSLAMRLTDDDEGKSVDLCFDEWKSLHATGIVPQKPRKDSTS